MKTQTLFEYLTGTVERIVFRNEESGFCVVRVQTKQMKDLITVVGVSAALFTGEEVQVQGTWHNDLNYGLQFKANFIRSVPPNSLEGIEKYLSSGAIKGIGPHLAKKLMDAFGDEVFDAIEKFPDKIANIKGIGRTRADMICSNWSEQSLVREIMVFLQSHNISSSKATKIYKTYGENAIKMVSHNPYRLAKDIAGIGFLSADRIARSLGIEEASTIRARAGINHTLTEALSRGHCGLPTQILLDNAEKLLSVPRDILSTALEEELKEQSVIKDQIDTVEVIFLAAYYHFEKTIASRLKLLACREPLWQDIDKDKALDWIETILSIKLAESQIKAIKTVISSKVTIITGGPGTGKTTILDAILRILKTKNFKIKLCAPTGRAAKRLSEATKAGATTIHRLLRYDPMAGQFTYNQHNPLDCDCLIVDESSMIDVDLMQNLLKAIPETSGLILVGDVDQLPSVGAGQVLKDLIDSNSIPTIKLNKIFRQANNSLIISNAHLINKGLFPKLDNDINGDFHFIEANTNEAVVHSILELVTTTIPSRFKLDPMSDIQILCPMQRGSCGAKSLNIELQKALNPLASEGLQRLGQTFSINDKVMQTLNNYDKDVFNGDLGFITELDQKTIAISFDNKPVQYSIDELDELQIAYAITIHKSQGSEYPAVIIPMTTQHFPMLRKKLLYTAITRGKQLVFLVGQKEAIALAVNNLKEGVRYSRLKQLLLKT